MLTGHIAVSALLKHYLSGSGLPLYGAAIFPDLVDKGLSKAGILPTGRDVGHSLLAAALTTGCVGIFWGRRAARDWGLSYLAHLICDTGGSIPWFYPFRRYDFEPSDRSISQLLFTALIHPTLAERLLLSWALAAPLLGK